MAAAYRNDFHLSLHPDPLRGATGLLDQQKSLLFSHGFLARDFDLGSWVARRAPARGPALARCERGSPRCRLSSFGRYRLAATVDGPTGGMEPGRLGGMTFRPSCPNGFATIGATSSTLSTISAIVKAVEHSGFSAIWIPYDPGATILGSSRVLRLGRLVGPERLSSFPRASPPLCMRQKWQRRFSGYLAGVSTGSWYSKSTTTKQSQGDFVRGDDRFARADEFLTVARSVWTGRDFDFDGRFYAVDAGGLGLR